MLAAAEKRFLVSCVTCLALLLARGASAQDQPLCGSDVKAYIVDVLSKYEKLDSPDALEMQKKLYAQFQYCAGDATKSFTPAASQFCGKVPLLGSLYYEQMRCCGYDPRKQLFGCPIDIKQPTGFGWAPLPGSEEHVLTCVDFGAGFEPVARDSVHLANAVTGGPIWQFAVIARASQRLSGLPLNGRTLRARSILSWELIPTDCKYRPTWGNALEYQIRLDP